MIAELYKDQAAQLGRDIDIHLWPVQYPTVGMVLQIAYVQPGEHPDTATHIDCGIYAVLMSVLVLNHQPLSVLLPAQVHKFRLSATHIISNQISDFNVVPHIRPTSVTNVTRKPKRKTQGKEVSSDITAHFDVVGQKDNAVGHTYVKESTIKGAANGLFAARIFDGNDDASAYVGEYSGGGSLTLEKINKKGRCNDYVIIFKGLIKDAWDHIRGRVQWRAGYTK